MTLAYVFPGQGGQKPGMGKALADAFPEARHALQEVDEALGQNLTRLMFEGPESDLTMTENAQPAIMASSIAAWRVMQKQLGIKAGDAAFMAGHSMGENTALCAAGAFDLASCARLLKLRGQSMQQATPPGIGAMAAIIGLDADTVRNICETAAQDEVCAIANFNSPEQQVISGHKAAVERAMVMAKERGAKRALPLSVSAPFHSPLMQPAEFVMQRALAEVAMREPAVPIIANVTAHPVKQVDDIRDCLVRQLTGSVRWVEIVQFMQKHGVTKIVEIGTGKVLTGLIRRIAPEIETANIEGPGDLDVLAKVA